MDRVQQNNIRLEKKAHSMSNPKEAQLLASMTLPRCEKSAPWTSHCASLCESSIKVILLHSNKQLYLLIPQQRASCAFKQVAPFYVVVVIIIVRTPRSIIFP